MKFGLCLVTKLYLFTHFFGQKGLLSWKDIAVQFPLRKITI